MLQEGIERAIVTKDEDLVLLLFDGKSWKIASVDQTEDLVRRLGATPSTRKDETNVACKLEISEGSFLIEFVRGRRGGHGYFVSRAVLEAVASLSNEEGAVLVPPLEALGFLKAWAATDQAKLVAKGHDRQGFHALRERAFRGDVAAIRLKILESRTPDEGIIGALMEECSAGRAKAIRKVLMEEGWLSSKT